MSTATYVVSSLAWSLAGFLLGWLLATLRQDVRIIRRAVMPNTPVATWRGHTMTAALATRVLGIIVSVLAIVTVASTFIANDRINDATACQAEYNRRFAEVQNLRARLAQEDRDALQNMLITLYQRRGASQAEQLEVFQQWVDTVRSSQRERKQNPLPELPRGDCR